MVEAVSSGSSACNEQELERVTATRHRKFPVKLSGLVSPDTASLWLFIKWLYKKQCWSYEDFCC